MRLADTLCPMSRSATARFAWLFDTHEHSHGIADRRRIEQAFREIVRVVVGVQAADCRDRRRLRARGNQLTQCSSAEGNTLCNAEMLIFMKVR
jgi:hypothetical protein